MLISVLSVAVVLFAGAPLRGGAQQELKQLQGEWSEVRLEADGMKFVPEADDPKVVLEIRNDKWFLDGMEKAQIVGIDPKTNPKCLDLKSVEKGRAGQIDEAIYKIEGVEYATASFKEGRVTALIDPGKTERAVLEAALKKKGVELKTP